MKMLQTCSMTAYLFYAMIVIIYILRKMSLVKEQMLKLMMPMIEEHIGSLDDKIIDFLKEESEKRDCDYNLLVTSSGIIAVSVNEETNELTQQTITFNNEERNSIKISEWIKSLIEKHK